MQGCGFRIRLKRFQGVRFLHIGAFSVSGPSADLHHWTLTPNNNIGRSMVATFFEDAENNHVWSVPLTDLIESLGSLMTWSHNRVSLCAQW